MAGRGHSGAKWRALAQAVRDQAHLVCGICGWRPTDRRKR